MKREIFRQVRRAMIGACALLLAGCGAQAPAQQAQEEAQDGQSRPKVEEKTEAERETDLKEESQETGGAAEPLADGIYTVVFDTDSSMFHLNESCAGRARLTVEEGVMTVHVPLVSKSIVHLFPGSAREAQAADESAWLQPVTEPVTYSDGYTEEVYAFDVPVPALDTEFELALIGTKGKWYDHTVRVTDPQPQELPAKAGEEEGAKTGETALENGTYRVRVSLLGGTGRADIGSYAGLVVSDEGMVATITWSSPFYDYMIVDGVRYEPVNTEGNSVFEIPVAALETEIAVTADTVAMSVPHEIAYTLIFDAPDTKEKGK